MARNRDRTIGWQRRTRRESAPTARPAKPDGPAAATLSESPSKGDAVSLSIEKTECKPGGGKLLRLPESKAFYQRTITRPGAVLVSAPYSVNEMQISDFEVYYVYDRYPDWIKVGRSVHGCVAGWVPASMAIDWNIPIIGAFTNSALRQRLIFLDSKYAWTRLLAGSRGADTFRDLIRGALAGQTGPVVAIEPDRWTDLDEHFYLMPILDWEIKRDSERFPTLRLLEVLSAPSKPTIEGNTSLIRQRTESAQWAVRLMYPGEIAKVSSPDLVRSWTIDRDPDESGAKFIGLRLLMNKNQLNDLVLTLNNIIRSLRAGQLEPFNFFNFLKDAGEYPWFDRSTSDTPSRLGALFGDFLDRLPYGSLFRNIDQGEWVRMTAQRQGAHISRLVELLSLYEQYNKSGGWVDLLIPQHYTRHYAA